MAKPMKSGYRIDSSLVLSPVIIASLLGVPGACSSNGEQHTPSDPGTDSSSDIEPDGGPLEEDVFLEQFVGAFCEALSPCCSMLGVPNDCPQTARRYVLQHKNDLVVRGMNWTFHAGHAKHCLEKVRSLPSDCSEYVRFQDCLIAFTGTVEPGGQCEMGWECAAAEEPWGEVETFCVYEGGGDGMCQRRYLIHDIGGPCNVYRGIRGEVEVCKDDGYCVFGECHPRSDLGGPCPCLEHLYCAESGCETRLSVGETCFNDSDCSSGACSRDDKSCLSMVERNALHCQ